MTDPLPDLVGDATGRGMPVDAGTIEIAAVEAGPEVRRRRRQRPRVRAWLAIGWLVLVVGARAPRTRSSRSTTRRRSSTEIARRGPFADAGTAPGHLLGGDFNGRDMLSRLLWGGRTTCSWRPLAVLLGFVLGGALGLVGGYFRGKVDTVVSALLDVFLAIPAVILASRSSRSCAPSPAPKAEAGSTRRSSLILAIGIVSIPLLGRITRASTLSWSEREFVLAAQRPGREAPAHHVPRGAARTCCPRCSRSRCSASRSRSSPRGRSASSARASSPTRPTWGNMIALGREPASTVAPHIVFEPALMIFFTVLALNLLGDVVRSRFDVREGGL